MASAPLSDKSLGQRSRPLTFLLYGIAGVYNYGCEAIVRGTTTMLRERWPECRVVYASSRAESDRQVLSDVDGLEVVPAFKTYGAMHITHAILKRILPRRPSTMLLDPAIIKQADVILSIGGDIYTLTGREHGTRYYHSLAELGERIMKYYRKPYVLWGASVGPFDSFPPSVEYFSKHLNRIPLITAREPRTVRYLKTLGCVENVVAVADPAFLMRWENGPLPFEVQAQDVLIAVNLSPLSLRYVFSGEDYERQKRILAESVRTLLQIKNARVILVPHVVSKDSADDDLRFLLEIHEHLKAEGERVTLLADCAGAQMTKRVLAACHMVVAARMHCGIAAVSAGVPTIFIGYSDKAAGMVEYVYGDTEWLLPLKEVNPQTLLALVVQMLGMREEVAEHVRALKSTWEGEARGAVDALARIVDRLDGVSA